MDRATLEGRLSGTVSPFRAEQGTSLETPSRARVVNIAMKGQHRYTEVNLDSGNTKSILTGSLAKEPCTPHKAHTRHSAAPAGDHDRWVGALGTLWALRTGRRPAWGLRVGAAGGLVPDGPG